MSELQVKAQSISQITSLNSSFFNGIQNSLAKVTYKYPFFIFLFPK